MQIPARTPANTAMTAATLDLMSGGRFLLGLGTSGPQVVEGWHGQPWGKPLAKTREYVEIVRAALRREALEFHGEHYDIPYCGDGRDRARQAAEADASARCAPRSRSTSQRSARRTCARGRDRRRLAADLLLARARARRVRARARRARGFDIAPTVPVIVSDDVEAGRDTLEPLLALYIGGMGARGANFYNALVRRYGYEAEAERDPGAVPRRASSARPPPRCPTRSSTRSRSSGRRERIADRLDAWRESGATTLLVATRDAHALRTMAEAVLVGAGSSST